MQKINDEEQATNQKSKTEFLEMDLFLIDHIY